MGSRTERLAILYLDFAVADCQPRTSNSGSYQI